MPFRLSLPVAVALSGLALVACGGDDAKSSTPASGPPCADNCEKIVADNVLFKTKEITANAGTVTLELDNQDPSVVVHNVTVKTPDGDKQVVSVNGGHSATGTIDLTAGSYQYVCTVPGHGAMKGTLTVK